MKDPEYPFLSVFNGPWAYCLRYSQPFVLGSQLLKVLSRLCNGVFACVIGGRFLQISVASHGKGDIMVSAGHCHPSHVQPLSDAELCGVSMQHLIQSHI